MLTRASGPIGVGQAILALFLLPLLGCGSVNDGEPQVCNPGYNKICACTGGVSGTKQCNSSGTGWYSCDCPDQPDPEQYPSIPLTVKVPANLKMPANAHPVCRVLIESIGMSGYYGPIFFGDDQEAQEDYDSDLSPGDQITLPMWADQYRVALDCGNSCSSWRELKLNSGGSGMVWEPDTCAVTVSAPPDIDCAIAVSAKAKDGPCYPHTSVSMGHFSKTKNDDRDWVLLENKYDVCGKLSSTNTELMGGLYDWECTDKEMVFDCY